MHCKKDTDTSPTGTAQHVLKELGKRSNSSSLSSAQLDLFALKLLGKRQLVQQNGGSAGHSEDELDCKSPASDGSTCTLKDEPRSDDHADDHPDDHQSPATPTSPTLASRYPDTLLMAYVNTLLLQKQTDSVDIDGRISFVFD